MDDTEKATTTTIQPDGSKIVQVVTRFRNPDGSISETTETTHYPPSSHPPSLATHQTPLPFPAETAEEAGLGIVPNPNEIYVPPQGGNQPAEDVSVITYDDAPPFVPAPTTTAPPQQPPVVPMAPPPPPAAENVAQQGDTSDARTVLSKEMATTTRPDGTTKVVTTSHYSDGTKEITTEDEQPDGSKIITTDHVSPTAGGDDDGRSAQQPVPVPFIPNQAPNLQVTHEKEPGTEGVHVEVGIDDQVQVHQNQPSTVAGDQNATAENQAPVEINPEGPVESGKAPFLARRKNKLLAAAALLLIIGGAGAGIGIALSGGGDDDSTTDRSTGNPPSPSGPNPAPSPTNEMIGPIETEDLVMTINGIDSLTPDAAASWENQTAAYMEEYFNENSNGDDTIQNAIFDVDATVEITGQEPVGGGRGRELVLQRQQQRRLEDLVAARSGSSGANPNKEKKVPATASLKFGWADNNNNNKNHRHLAGALRVTYKQTTTYRTSNTDIALDEVLKRPFVSDGDRVAYVTFLKERDPISFADVETISGVEGGVPQPTPRPTSVPSGSPSKGVIQANPGGPGVGPSSPTVRPTNKPSGGGPLSPTVKPTNRPTPAPSRKPTRNPTSKPTNKPTPAPTRKPTSTLSTLSLYYEYVGVGWCHDASNQLYDYAKFDNVASLAACADKCYPLTEYGHLGFEYIGGTYTTPSSCHCRFEDGSDVDSSVGADSYNTALTGTGPIVKAGANSYPVCYRLKDYDPVPAPSPTRKPTKSPTRKPTPAPAPSGGGGVTCQTLWIIEFDDPQYCPSDPGSLPDCLSVGLYEYCETDGECSWLDTNHDNCGAYDVYYRVPGDSCNGKCNGSAGDCWCDSLCVSNGDCCTDACQYCGVDWRCPDPTPAPTPPPVSTSSCQNYCFFYPLTEANCPDNPSSLPKCDSVDIYEFCESNGECGLDNGLDSCDGVWDVYLRVPCDSCSGDCGVLAGDCWCDSNCIANEDCCLDACDECALDWLCS